ncbi:hypothetical protein [Candidatus Halobonum tyrrellensis]|uniref:Uncharacterized protein n=1 Tax=Candidatus Halobonum tyrrellensis G22 TaxID=1324957 RepID=V4GS55_9EURY|nr:hypothetical protein [Candidatus Halobonum tyrrellensis]ESP87906.1 hypothetical protein K933_11336 [Candidatus Halobonum tyrrellensis G22]
MPSTRTSPWRYGVALFPLPVLLSVGATLASDLFLAVSLDDQLTDADVLAGIAGFVLGVAASWLAALAALVVLVAVVLDARALRRADADFAPRTAFVAGVGVVHLVAAALFAPLYVVSVPALAYYTYRRFESG